MNGLAADRGCTRSASLRLGLIWQISLLVLLSDLVALGAATNEATVFFSDVYQGEGLYVLTDSAVQGPATNGCLGTLSVVSNAVAFTVHVVNGYSNAIFLCAKSNTVFDTADIEAFDSGDKLVASYGTRGKRDPTWWLAPEYRRIQGYQGYFREPLFGPLLKHVWNVYRFPCAVDCRPAGIELGPGEGSESLLRALREAEYAELRLPFKLVYLVTGMQTQRVFKTVLRFRLQEAGGEGQGRQDQPGVAESE